MSGRGGAGALVAAAVTGVVLLAGPVHAGQGSGESGSPAVVQAAAPAVQADPCAVPPGGEAPLMCQSGVVDPAEADAEPVTAPTAESEDRTGLLGALAAGAVAVTTGAVLLLRRRRPAGRW